MEVKALTGRTTKKLITAREMIEFASERVTELWQLKHEITPMWHAITADDKYMIIPPPCEDKDDSASLIRALFELQDVVRYVFFAEAWTLNLSKEDNSKEELDAMHKKGIADHPDRRETVIFVAEDEHGFVMAHRKITRPERGFAVLEPLAWDEDFTQTEGRLVGMLPRRSTMQ